MPEGPSIVILKEQAAKFAGKVVREASGNSKQPLQRMQGLRLRRACSWGKHFLLDFGAFSLRIHFLLFGSSRVDDPKEGVAPRVRLRFDNGQLDLYACSVRFIDAPLDEVYDWSVDVMADAWDPARARRTLRARPHVIAADALVEEARAYSFDFLEWKKAYVLKKHYQVHTKTHCPRDGTRLAYRKHLGRAQRRAFFCEACQKRYGGGAGGDGAAARAPSRRTR